MTRSKSIFHLITSWILYAVLITILASVQVLILPVAQEGISGLDNFLLVDMGRVLVKFLLLSVTGFLVYGFIRLGLGYLSWFNRASRGYITRITVFYVVITVSMLITYLFTYDALPVGIMIDLPILNAIGTLIFGSLPYFKHTLFRPQEA